jgi:hypothetical protein
LGKKFWLAKREEEEAVWIQGKSMKRKCHSFGEEALVGKKAILGKKFWLAKREEEEEEAVWIQGKSMNKKCKIGPCGWLKLQITPWYKK